MSECGHHGSTPWPTTWATAGERRLAPPLCWRNSSRSVPRPCALAAASRFRSGGCIPRALLAEVLQQKDGPQPGPLPPRGALVATHPSCFSEQVFAPQVDVHVDSAKWSRPEFSLPNRRNQEQPLSIVTAQGRCRVRTPTVLSPLTIREVVWGIARKIRQRLCLHLEGGCVASLANVG